MSSDYRKIKNKNTQPNNTKIQQTKKPCAIINIQIL